MQRQSATASLKILTAIVIGLAIVIAVVAVVVLDTTGKKGSGLGREYSYDIEELAKIDPNMILYAESADPFKTELAESRAIAIGPDGSIYIAGDEEIRIFDGDGDLQKVVQLSDAPRCLAVGADSKIYVGMKDYVKVYDDKAVHLGSWRKLGENAVLTSIAVYRDNVFVADAGNRVVIRYDASGNITNEIGRRDRDKGIDGFVIPSPYFDLAVASDGLLRVCNPGQHQIEAYTFDGDLEFSWGKFSADLEGFVGCCNPVNFAMLADDSFITCEKGLTRVKLYDPQGTLVGAVAGPEQLLEGGSSRICTLPAECQSGGFDVAVDGGGRVLVLDTIKNVVRIFSRKKAI